MPVRTRVGLIERWMPGERPQFSSCRGQPRCAAPGAFDPVVPILENAHVARPALLAAAPCRFGGAGLPPPAVRAGAPGRRGRGRPRQRPMAVADTATAASDWIAGTPGHRYAVRLTNTTGRARAGRAVGRRRQRGHRPDRRIRRRPATCSSPWQSTRGQRLAQVAGRRRAVRLHRPARQLRRAHRPPRQRRRDRRGGVRGGPAVARAAGPASVANEERDRGEREDDRTGGAIALRPTWPRSQRRNRSAPATASANGRRARQHRLRPRLSLAGADQRTALRRSPRWSRAACCDVPAVLPARPADAFPQGFVADPPDDR